MFYDGVEISPVGRDENGIGVWWGEQKIALAAPPLLTKNSDNLPFQRMTSTEDRYLLWKRVMVGNLSSDRSTVSTMSCCYGLCARTRLVPGCCSTSSVG